MSKQYLTTHTIDNASVTDILSLAVTEDQIIAASGASSIRIWSTAELEFPQKQKLQAHSIGCHHVVVSRDGKRLASAGFDGQCIIWTLQDGQWIEQARIKDGNAAGEIWAIALSQNGQYLASTTHDGRINIWDAAGNWAKIRSFETKGSFGVAIDMSADGCYTASGHQNGALYVFNNETGRLAHSLAGLIKAVRAIAISPASRLLAAAGDSKVIALYDINSGEQIGNLSGHNAWIMTLDWSDTGEYLLSGAYDGKTKVWSMETRTCVATHTETDKTIWSVKWLPKTSKSEMFAAAGANKSISFYREAS